VAVVFCAPTSLVTVPSDKITQFTDRWLPFGPTAKDGEHIWGMHA
jgi:hypothetical protein